MSKIYVASSWRNERQQNVVKELREADHDVYDFKNPEPFMTGFSWSSIDENWKQWTPEEYMEALDHPSAITGFGRDLHAMKWADTFVGVQPFGRSASLEMGWAAGNGKKTILLLDNGEPELMVKMLDKLCVNMNQVLAAITLLKPQCMGISTCGDCGPDCEAY